MCDDKTTGIIVGAIAGFITCEKYAMQTSVKNLP